MNNDNRKKPDSDRNDSDNIITKKGFLISLPSKKKNSGTKTSINLSPSQNGAVMPQQSLAKPADRGTKDSKGSNEAKPIRPADSGKPKRRKAPSDIAQSSQNVQNPQNSQNAQNGEKSRFKNKPQKPVEVSSDRNDGEQRKGSAQRKDRRTDKSRRQDNAESAKDVRAEKQKPAKKDKARINDKQEQKSGKSVQSPKGRKGDEAAHGKNRRAKEKNPARENLSALSADMAAFGALKDYEKSRSAQSYTPELSLEEKYKNAVPLAEQIAAEQQRARLVPGQNPDGEKQEIVGIRFREAGKIYYFDPDGSEIPFGTPVIVETARGCEYGYTAISNRFIPTESIVSPLKKILRTATEEDTRRHLANKVIEKQGEQVFREKVAALGLEMNLIYVEYTFDNSKLLFYFTAETRIDFRELVKELASVFRTRIELRQIGVRDEAKILGGLGICGRCTCCSSFLGDFAQVSIKMAKDQNLSLNAAKISGACGKLMCCLRYEDKVYEQENARTPKIGAIVETPDGRGTVTERNALRGTVGVKLDEIPDAAAKTFSRDDVSTVGFNKSEQQKQEVQIDENADEIKEDSLD